MLYYFVAKQSGPGLTYLGMGEAFLNSRKDWVGHRDQRWGGFTYSQHGEDLMILNLLELIGAKRPYTYLDIGCHHPVNISNTFLLYERGALGVCVDPNPNITALFAQVRPRDIVINQGVAPRRGRMTYYMHDSTSGLNTFSESERDKMIQAGLEIRESKEIDVVTLISLVKKYFPSGWPDLLSLDVEGMDYEILAGLDLELDGPDVICVEVRRDRTQDFLNLMNDKRYSCVARMAENLLFVPFHYKQYAIFG